MIKVTDKGALIAAVAAVVISLTTWVWAEGSRSQQLHDLEGQVSQLSLKVDRLQTVIDDYLLRHDGH